MRSAFDNDSSNDELPDEADLDLDLDLDEEFPLGDGVADLVQDAYCPYCGEPVEITLDPGSGTHQQYVEDCSVCCRPWRVFVTYHADGTADVSLAAEDEG